MSRTRGTRQGFLDKNIYEVVNNMLGKKKEKMIKVNEVEVSTRKGKKQNEQGSQQILRPRRRFRRNDNEKTQAREPQDKGGREETTTNRLPQTSSKQRGSALAGLKGSTRKAHKIERQKSRKTKLKQQCSDRRTRIDDESKWTRQTTRSTTQKVNERNHCHRRQCGSSYRLSKMPLPSPSLCE